MGHTAVFDTVQSCLFKGVILLRQIIINQLLPISHGAVLRQRLWACKYWCSRKRSLSTATTKDLKSFSPNGPHWNRFLSLALCKSWMILHTRAGPTRGANKCQKTKETQKLCAASDVLCIRFTRIELCLVFGTFWNGVVSFGFWTGCYGLLELICPSAPHCIDSSI